MDVENKRILRTPHMSLLGYVGYQMERRLFFRALDQPAHLNPRLKEIMEDFLKMQGEYMPMGYFSQPVAAPSAEHCVGQSMTYSVFSYLYHQ